MTSWSKSAFIVCCTMTIWMSDFGKRNIVQSKSTDKSLFKQTPSPIFSFRVACSQMKLNLCGVSVLHSACGESFRWWGLLNGTLCAEFLLLYIDPLKTVSLLVQSVSHCHSWSGVSKFNPTREFNRINKTIEKCWQSNSGLSRGRHPDVYLIFKVTCVIITTWVIIATCVTIAHSGTAALFLADQEPSTKGKVCAVHVCAQHRDTGEGLCEMYT